MNKHFLSVSAAAVAVLLLAACGSEATATEANDTAGTETVPAETETAEATEEERLMPDIPDTDFGGAEIRFLSREITDERVRYYSEVAVSETNGELMNDATYERTVRIEETYNVKIVNDTTSDVMAQYKKSFKAGEDNWDVLVPNFSSAIAMISSPEYLKDFNEMPYININQPWWDTRVSNDLSVGGHIYVSIGAMNTWTDSHTSGITFNRELASSYDLDPFQEVANNNWTLDTFISMGKTVAADINGDSTMDENDRYGFGGSYSNFYALMTGGGARVVSKDEDDYPYYNITSKFYDIADKVVQVIDDNYMLIYEKYTGKSNDAANEILRASFRAGNILFLVGGLEELILCRDLDTEIGLVPFPKYDESDDYTTTFSYYWASVLTLPSSSQNTEMTGLILEALNADSYYGTSETYYEALLKGRALRDETSEKMLDIIRGARTMDWENAFDYLSLQASYEKVAKQGDAGILSSQIEKMLPKAEAKLAKLFES